MKVFILIWFLFFNLAYSNPVRSKRNSAPNTDDDEFLCFNHPHKEYFYYSKETLPSDLIGTKKDQTKLCCATFKMDDDLLKPTYYVKHYSQSSTFEESIKKYVNMNACFKSSEYTIHCCCTESKCNHANFALYNYNIIQRQPNIFSGIEIILFFASLFVAALILVLIFVVSRYTCLEKYSGEQRTELTAMKNIDLRGIIVQPYHSPTEVESIISAIKNLKSSTPHEPTVFKKINFRCVTTFSTIDDLTIREPAPIELPPLTSKDPCMEMISHMVRYGPKEIKFDAASLILCYEKALKVLKAEPVLQEASLPVAMYGDLHGQYSDLIRWFHVNGWPPTTRCVFLGDYVDRGRHGLEVITLLLCLKAVMPNDVYLNRGNHEDAIISRNYSFYAEVINRLPGNSKLNQQVFDKLLECFAWMPLATRLNNKILCMHGGLSPRIESWESIAEIKRPVFNLVPNTLSCDLTWSDPDKKSDEYIVNFKRDKKNGIGFMFGHKQVHDICKLLDIQLIVRGHQAPMNGYEFFTPKMCTIFSAPGYRGNEEEANFGASLYIDEKGNIDITRIGVSNNVRRERNRQKLDKGEGYPDWSEIKDRPLEDGDEKSC